MRVPVWGTGRGGARVHFSVGHHVTQVGRAPLRRPCAIGFGRVEDVGGRLAGRGGAVDDRAVGAAGPDVRFDRPGYAGGFPTPSGRLEFRSARAAGAGADPLAGYVPPFEVADPERARRYPLALVSAASHEFLNTQFANNPELRRRAGDPAVRVHPDDAAARGLADGQRVRVGNDRGSFEAVLRVSDQVRPGVAATSKGHWPKFAGGSNANAVVDERATDLGGGPVFHDTRVEITAAG